jgi:hypothetical protein
MNWARRLKRAFGVEIDPCARCGGKLKIITGIEEPAVIAKNLAHLELAAPGPGRISNFLSVTISSGWGAGAVARSYRALAFGRGIALIGFRPDVSGDCNPAPLMTKDGHIGHIDGVCRLYP